jgi:hypothetical protein
MLLGRRPPAEILRIAEPDWRYKESSCTEAEVTATWNALVKVMGSRDKAFAAVRKNQAVIVPYLNTPARIAGAHRTLVSMLGPDAAASVVERNPGVLACDPLELSCCSPADIERTAGAVSWVDSWDPNVKAGIPFLTWLALVGTIGGRVIVCSGGQCGSAEEWDLKGGLGVQLKQQVLEWLGSISTVGA